MTPKISFQLLSVILFAFFCALLFILPWFWIPKGFVYTSEEPNFINYDIKLARASTMWTKDGGFGTAGDPSNQSLLIPNAVFYASGKALGLDGSTTQKLFISFIFLAIGLSFALFSSIFTKNRLLGLLGLLVYVFNFYTVSSLGYTAKMLQLVLMPALFYVTYRYLKTKDFRYVIQNFIWVFSFQAVFTNLPLALTSLFIYIISFAYFLFSERKWSLRDHLVRLLILILTIIPIVAHHFVIYLTVLVAMKEMPSFFAFTAIGAPLSLLIQLRGVWWEKSGHLWVDYFPLWRFYSHFLVVISAVIGFGVLILASLEMTWHQSLKPRIGASFWLGTYLFGVLLASGLYFFPDLYQWIMVNLPLMVMFREPWAKFVPYMVFSLSGLTLVLLDHLSKTDRKKYFILSMVLVLHLCVQSFPFISGKIIDSEVRGWKSRLVQIPRYWEEFSRWTEVNQKTILPLPFGTTAFNSKYNWHESRLGNTVLPMPCLLGKSNVICDNYQDRYTSTLRAFAKEKNFDLIYLGGIDLVMFQEDLDTSAAGNVFDWQGEAITPFIESIPIATFGGKLSLYQVKEKYLRPKIYATRNILTVEKSEPISHIPVKDFAKDGVFVFSETSVPKTEKPSMMNTRFDKVSQTEYDVSVNSVITPFILVFNESFDQGWRIPTSGIVSKHLVVNGYSNGWYIIPNQSCVNSPCQIDLKIEYQPQKYFAVTMLINIILFTLALVSLSAIFTIKVIRRNE